MNTKFVTLLVIVILLQSMICFAQEEDLAFIKDLYLSDTEYEKKYIDRFLSVKDLIKAYFESQDTREKIVIMKRLSDFLEDHEAFKTVLKICERSSYKGSPLWKLRASAIYLLGKKGKKLEKEKQLVIQKRAVHIFRQDTNSRVISAAAFCLVNIAVDEPFVESSHSLFNKRTIAQLLAEKLLSLKPHENFLCWALTKACIQLNDSYVYLALKEIRKKPFQPNVLAELKKALQKLKKTSN